MRRTTLRARGLEVCFRMVDLTNNKDDWSKLSLPKKKKKKMDLLVG